ncbi:hypothetical protein [Leifsonia sp. RAF41]|uniref:hypothetical protein n=1 Tax=Leifsonia sp. RAF41 TaxID=3233056 RepID=UPI003F975A84
MQFTPPESEALIIFGTGLTDAPAESAQGLQLTVYDIEEARSGCRDDERRDR